MKIDKEALHSPISLSMSLIEALEDVRVKGIEYAKKKRIYEELKKKEKPYFCSLMPSEGSQGFKEQIAYKSLEYKNYLNGEMQAFGEFNLADVEYEHAKLSVEVIRTITSTMREEIKNFKG